MKYLLMLIAMFSMVHAMPVKADNTEPDVHIVIKLEAETDDDRNRDLLMPYEAWLTGTTVSVTALETTQEVTYTILSPSGAVVDRYIGATAAMQCVQLNASGHESGVYTLLITTPGGTYIYGIFSL